MTRALLGFVVACIVVGCTPGETELPERRPMNRDARLMAADVAGCYRIELGPWIPEVDVPAPAKAELTIETIPPSPGLAAPTRPQPGAEYRLRLHDGRDPDFPRARTWSLAGSSEVEIRWSSEGTAVKARVTIDRRTRDLRGMVQTLNGPHPNQSSATIRLVRNVC